jgi:hypothetical protein
MQYRSDGRTGTVFVDPLFRPLSRRFGMLTCSCREVNSMETVIES